MLPSHLRIMGGQHFADVRLAKQVPRKYQSLASVLPTFCAAWVLIIDMTFCAQAPWTCLVPLEEYKVLDRRAYAGVYAAAQEVSSQWILGG